jgi:hypothetical protein
MKTLPILILLSATIAQTNAVSIDEAYKKGLIQYEINGTSQGNTGACIAINFTNISSTIINLEVETGRILEASDSSYQNMIVSKRYFVRLQPKQKTTQNIYALCAEPGDVTPNNGISFTHGKMATGSLLGMAKYVEANNLQNGTGQSLIWAIINGITTFYSCDYLPNMYASLKNFFATDKQIKFEECTAINNIAHKPVTTTVRRYKGSFGFSLPQDSEVEISLFDEDGNKVKQLDYNKKMEANWYDYEYEFTNANLPKGKTYELKLVINGKPKKVLFIDN